MAQMVQFKTPTGTTEVDLFSIITEKDVRKSGKANVISYDGCKKIADFFGVVIKDNPMFLSQPNRENMQQHIRGMWLGYKGDESRDNRQFCEGEASQLNT